MQYTVCFLDHITTPQLQLAGMRWSALGCNCTRARDRTVISPWSNIAIAIRSDAWPQTASGRLAATAAVKLTQQGVAASVSMRAAG